MKMTIRIILAQFYRITFQVFFNLIFNGWHLAKIILTGKLLEAKIARAIALGKVFDGDPPKMKYQFDGITQGKGTLGKWPCWTAYPLVFAGMGLKGNCMDGAKFVKTALGFCDEQARVRIWIPDGEKWYARIHYVCESVTRKEVWSLERKGLIQYSSLEACRSGGRWI